ncbi:hypothetical protein HMPREF0433_00945 [Gemella sanguinis M325]|uniref:DUF1146 domain-containing protein n=1 Tax=Gemella sanguinis TaxID=84135 RepID=A0ABX6FEK0_9BACL|nr:DUF1146 family protein [Gemella sanguinis]EGF87760.1 hypothetical protein HMPREF0433_00945 [Gemella sanguinis M325]QGS06925.1 DUF1146 domain-containing protein [Gemella sanguinis]
MNIFKLTVLFIMILLSNFALLKVDFGKIFKKNSTREIKIFVSILSLALGYVSYMTIITIYELSLNLFK